MRKQFKEVGKKKPNIKLEKHFLDQKKYFLTKFKSLWFDAFSLSSMNLVCCDYLKIEKLSRLGKGVCKNKLEGILQEALVA